LAIQYERFDEEQMFCLAESLKDNTVRLISLPSILCFCQHTLQVVKTLILAWNQFDKQGIQDLIDAIKINTVRYILYLLISSPF
jgi:hypothetical protein